MNYSLLFNLPSKQVQHKQVQGNIGGLKFIIQLLRVWFIVSDRDCF